jgi:outer membrane protein OmpA-like peptidoglycan-associated protein
MKAKFSHSGLLFLTISLYFNISVFSQNLVANGSFENHDDVQCTSCYNVGQFQSVMKNWTFKNWLSPYICNKKYKIYSYNDCDLSKYSPRDGETLVELIYRNAKVQLRGSCEQEGYANYLETKLLKTLEKNKVYRISISFSVSKKASLPFTPEYAKYIGIDLSSQPLTEPYKPYACTRFSPTPFVLDTTLTEVWVDKTWYIKPTAALNYLQIGIFFNAECMKTLDKLRTDGRYGVDNISIVEMLDISNIASKNVIEYPFIDTIKKRLPIVQQIPQTLQIDDLYYFDLDKFKLNDIAFKRLDSLNMLLKKAHYNNVIDIVGHTDSIGTKEKNKTLSQNRAQVIYNYLLSVGVPFYCMNTEYKGSSKPLASNITENGRALNRRVQVVNSEYGLAEQYYYHASKYAENSNIDSAFLFLKRWINLEKTSNKTILFLDNDLDVLRKDARWLQLYNEIKSTFKVFKKPELAFLLDSLYNADQLFRTLPNRFEEGKKYLPKRLDTLSNQDAEVLMSKQNEVNMFILRNLLKKYGWPKISEVGKKASKAAYLIVDHADINIMKEFLPYLENTCKEKEAPWEWYATLYDRIQITEGKPQRYGTQYERDSKDPFLSKLSPLEYPDKVDELRRDLGMEPISVREIRIKIKSN